MGCGASTAVGNARGDPERQSQRPNLDSVCPGGQPAAGAERAHAALEHRGELHAGRTPHPPPGAPHRDHHPRHMLPDVTIHVHIRSDVAPDAGRGGPQMVGPAHGGFGHRQYHQGAPATWMRHDPLNCHALISELTPFMTDEELLDDDERRARLRSLVLSEPSLLGNLLNASEEDMQLRWGEDPRHFPWNAYPHDLAYGAAAAGNRADVAVQTLPYHGTVQVQYADVRPFDSPSWSPSDSEADHASESDDDDELIDGMSRNVHALLYGSQGYDPSAPRRLRDAAIANLPLCIAEGKHSDDLCPICLDNFKVGESTLITLPCGHFFHQGCIDTWLRRKATCPSCQKQLTLSDVGRGPGYRGLAASAAARAAVAGAPSS
eukprot:TRINITY_DN12393_c0_g1_i1.p1 TRINITY_DN12393_c0_g1~~TRINITY_DN12393_c0_g1_i1.p1  ORF type:complete len:377 (+),score=77.75 TRINITY_DN12393_c0_g1_i1:133-1263(+)